MGNNPSNKASKNSLYNNIRRKAKKKGTFEDHNNETKSQ